uniref:Uncharacterized protein n=1 Tax=Oryza meridionalis TaxID=40149 RepID=A0A0E0C373_9ORYZ
MPSQESELAITNPGDVIASTYYMRVWERDAGVLREELWSVKAKLEFAEAKAAAAGALAEKVREAYERDREDMRCAVLCRYPHLDLARIVVALPGDDAGTSADRPPLSLPPPVSHPISGLALPLPTPPPRSPASASPTARCHSAPVRAHRRALLPPTHRRSARQPLAFLTEEEKREKRREGEEKKMCN